MITSVNDKDDGCDHDNDDILIVINDCAFTYARTQICALGATLNHTSLLPCVSVKEVQGPGRATCLVCLSRKYKAPVEQPA